MIPRELDENTLAAIRRLVEQNYLGRDRLYAAADLLDSKERKKICQRLAEFLAAHATELQQILLACEARPFDIADLPAVAEATLLDIVKANHGTAGVIEVAMHCEQEVKEHYDQATSEITETQTQGLLRRHRADVEFGEHVLRAINDTPKS